MSDSILKGAFTSELTLEWLGLYVITINCSIVCSRMRKSLQREDMVTVRVYVPLKSACCKNHLSRTIFKHILFSIEVVTKNSMISAGLV